MFVPVSQAVRAELFGSATALLHADVPRTITLRSFPVVARRRHETLLSCKPFQALAIASDDHIERYADAEVLREAGIPEEGVEPVQRFVQATAAFGEAVIEKQKKDLQGSSSRIPAIRSLADLDTVFVAHGGDSNFPYFHADKLRRVFVSDSNVPTLLTERELPEDAEHGPRVRSSSDDDGYNIPECAIKRAREGEVALWDAMTAVHSAPTYSGRRRFVRCEFEVGAR